MRRTTILGAITIAGLSAGAASAATLDDVVEHYDAVLDLGLDPGQKVDLVEYLKSL